MTIFKLVFIAQIGICFAIVQRLGFWRDLAGVQELSLSSNLSNSLHSKLIGKPTTLK